MTTRKRRPKPAFIRPTAPAPGTIVLGVDASSKATGLAFIRSATATEHAQCLSLDLLKPTASWPFHSRVDWLCDQIHKRLPGYAGHVPALVVLEQTDGALWMARARASAWASSVVPLAGAQAAIRETIRRAFPLAKLETYTSTQWTQRKPKDERAAWLKSAVPAYRGIAARDAGFDVADALGLAIWRLGY